VQGPLVCIFKPNIRDDSVVGEDSWFGDNIKIKVGNGGSC
jgi:hypothetical protein